MKSTRRTFLGFSLVSALLAATAQPGHASSANSGLKFQKRPKPIKLTPNGWPVQNMNDKISTVERRPVAGTALAVDLRIGDAELLLVRLIQQINNEIQDIHAGELTGWEPMKNLHAKSPEANLASGTAVRIRPGARVDAYYPMQEIMLREILSRFDGVIAWGGDFRYPDQSLFYVSVKPTDAKFAKVARKLRKSVDIPGTTNGSTY